MHYTNAGCSITVVFSGNIQPALGASVHDLARFDIEMYGGVDQTTPIKNAAVATGNDQNPTVDIDTNAHNTLLGIFAGDDRQGATGNYARAHTPSTNAGNVFIQDLNPATGALGAFMSYVDSDVDGTNTFGFTLATRSVNWSLSVISIVASGDASVTVGPPTESDGGCSGDCTPPTLGVNERGQKLVDDGFTYNGQTVDAELYYTPFPLITTNVGEKNTAVFRIYENGGVENLSHFEFAFGIKGGDKLNESLASIIWDKSWDGIETVTLDDPLNALTDVSLAFHTEKCLSESTYNFMCTIITVDHTFRKPLNYDIVATSMWDKKLNQWNNYFNDGVRIVGESMDPPPTVTVAFGTHEMRGLHELTQLDAQTDTWTDKFGNVYKNHGNNYFEKISKLKQGAVSDYISQSESNSNNIDDEFADFISSYYKTSVSSDSEYAEINYVNSGIVSNSFDGMNSLQLHESMKREEIKALTLLSQNCIECVDLPFDDIDNTKSIDYSSISHEELNKHKQQILHSEYFDAVKIFDNLYGHVYNNELILVKPSSYVVSTIVDKDQIIQNEQLEAEKIFLQLYGKITGPD